MIFGLLYLLFIYLLFSCLSSLFPFLDMSRFSLYFLPLIYHVLSLSIYIFYCCIFSNIFRCLVIFYHVISYFFVLSIFILFHRFIRLFFLSSLDLNFAILYSILFPFRLLSYFYRAGNHSNHVSLCPFSLF